MLPNQKAFDFTEAFEINQIPTEFVCHKFANKIFCIITQFGKINNLYSVKNQVFTDESMPLATRNTQIFDIQQKFGAPSIEIEGAIRYLMNFISQPMEIIICLGLKQPEEISREVLTEIKDVLITHVPYLSSN